MSDNTIKMSDIDRLEFKCVILKAKYLEEQNQKLKLLIEKNMFELENLRVIQTPAILNKYKEEAENKKIDLTTCDIDVDEGLIFTQKA